MALKLLQADDQIQVKDSDLVADGDPEVVYTIRHLTPEKNREFVKAHTKDVINRRTHVKDPVVDWDAVGDALYDYALADWTGVIVGDGPAPCDAVHKGLLDGPRRAAILERAGMNEVNAAPERRAASFRAAS